MSLPAQPADVSSTGIHAPDEHVGACGLSTDYLNHFAEALMLIEMASFESAAIGELSHWRPAGYADHFARSELRCAPHALEAYMALGPEARGAFEALCSAMNRLVETVILTLQQLANPDDAHAIVSIAAAAFRNLLARATAFINSGGDMERAAYDTVELQDAIDQLMAA